MLHAAHGWSVTTEEQFLADLFVQQNRNLFHYESETGFNKLITAFLTFHWPQYENIDWVTVLHHTRYQKVISEMFFLANGLVLEKLNESQ